MKMKPKTVVILPGSYWQIPIVKKSKSLGYRTLAVNPYADSPVFPYADGYLQRDIFDIEHVVQYCRKEKADAVISEQCDIAMPLIAEIGQRLDLETLDLESAHLFTNKFAMRNFCRSHGIPFPEYTLCETSKDAEDFFDAIKSSIVIKPLDSNSSRGVYTCSSKEEIKTRFDKALAYSRYQRAVLAERYIDGPEFTVDGIKTPEQHFTLAISEKKHFAHNRNIACELFFTGYSEKYDYQSLEEQNNLFVNLSPLKFGLTHAEYKYENGKFYLIEIAARGGGNLISSHIVPFMSGFDTYKYLLNCSLGLVTSPDFTVPERYRNRCAVLRFFETPKDGGVVKRIDGAEFLESMPQIVAYKFNFGVGDKIVNASTDADRVGFYIACCKDKQELAELIWSIQNKVQIICAH